MGYKSKLRWLFLESLSARYLLAIVPAISVLFLLFGVVLYRIEKPEAMRVNAELAEVVTSKTCHALVKWVESQISLSQSVAADPRVVELCLHPLDPEVRKKAQSFLTEVHARHPYCENVPIAIRLDDNDSFFVPMAGAEGKLIKNGNFIIDTVQGRTIGKCGPDFSYIKNVFAGKPYFISEVYPSILQGNPIFVVAAPVINDGKVIGAAIVAPRMDYFTKYFVENSKVGDTGYMIITDENGNIISHPDKKLILKKDETERLRPITDKIRDGEALFMEEFGGRMKQYSVSKLGTEQFHMDDSWFVVFCREEAEILKPLWDFILKMLLCIFAIACAISLAIYFLTKKMVADPLSRLTNAAGKIAEGDLSVEIARKRGSDEVSILSRSIDEMLSSLREQISNSVATAETMDTTSGSISRASKEQEEAMQDLGRNLAGIASSAKEISSNCGELAGTMNSVKIVSDEASILAGSSKDALIEMLDSMRTLSKETNEVSARLSAISVSAEKIGGIVMTMTKIADQTNLLSLNAAIEAEKAGKHGLGFSVVASEIRRLADKTAVATLDIKKLIGAMGDSVSDGVECMEAFKRGVAQELDLVDELSRRLSAVFEKISGLAPQFEKVNEGMHSQLDGSRHISRAIAELSDGARKITDALARLKMVAEELRASSGKHMDAVSKYKLGDPD